MSTARRKVGYYNLVFCKDIEDGKKFFDEDIFLKFLEYINSLDQKQKMQNNRSQKKVIKFDSAIKSKITFNEDIKKTEYISYKALFKSCKYEHVPKLMDSDTGNEREGDKKQTEGEVEKTHLYLTVKKDEVMVIAEERKSGVSMKAITSYLNKMFRKYCKNIKIKKDCSIVCGLVQNEDFIKTLENMERVIAAELYIDKKILGSESLNLLNRQDRNLRRDVMISMKSKNSMSLGKHNLKELYNQIIGKGSKITKIRIYGKDDNKKDISIDSEIMKRADYINAQLDSKGIVITSSIFAEMEDSMKCEKI